MINNRIDFYVQSSTAPVPSASVSCNVWDENSSGYIADGQVVVTDPFGNVATTAGVNLNGTPTMPSTIVLRWRQGNTVHQTAEIPVNAVTSYKVSTYRPALEQSTVIGYNATNNTTGHFVNPDALTGAVDDSVNYSVTLFREDDDFYMGIDRPKSAIYKAGTNALYRGSNTFATQQEVVLALGDMIYKEFIKTITGYSQVDLPIKVERICTTTQGTKTALGQTLTVSNESNIATAGGNVTITKGTLISIAGKIYVVAEAVTAGTRVVLDIPYQGTSATVASGVTSTTVFTYDPTTAVVPYLEKWGLQITGKSKTFYQGLWRYEKVRFQAQVNENVNGAINNFGICDTGINTKGLTTSTTAYVLPNTLIPNITAFEGVGTYQKVMEDEWNNMGFFGTEKQYRLSVDRESKRTLQSSINGTSVEYSILNIEFKKQWTGSTIGTINDSGNVIVAIPVAFTDNGATAISIAETNALAANYGFIKVLDAVLPAGVAAPQANYVNSTWINS
jgi:hypothetical protein